MFGGRSHEPPTNQVPMLYAFNTTICPTVGLTYHTRLISEATARDIATAKTVTSAIGHEATAQVASVVLGQAITVNRIAAEMVAGDEAICIKLRGRAPEGVILTREQMDEIGYDIVHMLATGTTSPAAIELSRWADPDTYYNWPGSPPHDIEFTTPIVLRRLESEQAEKVRAQLEAGISYNGSDPAGMLRTSMLTMLRRVVHEHLNEAVAAVRGEGGKVTDDDLGRMRQELVDRLLVQISEHGLQVHCGYGERDG